MICENAPGVLWPYAPVRFAPSQSHGTSMLFSVRSGCVSAGAGEKSFLPCNVPTNQVVRHSTHNDTHDCSARRPHDRPRGQYVYPVPRPWTIQTLLLSQRITHQNGAAWQCPGGLAVPTSLCTGQARRFAARFTHVFIATLARVRGRLFFALLLRAAIIRRLHLWRRV